jgi:serine/threonine protein kinase
MGAVFKAIVKHLDRVVAIKILPADCVSDPGQSADSSRKPMPPPPSTTPIIITIYDIESSDGFDFIVMEYVNGHTLRQVIHPGILPLHNVIKYGIALI